MRTVAILQARMGSTRLPGKVLLPLAGRPMVQHIIERVNRATTLDDMVLAIPGENADTPLRCLPCPAFCVRDIPEDDLIARYVACARTYKAEVIVRIACDNPCIDPAFIDEAVRQYRQFPFAFYSNTTAYVQGVAVDGIGVEVLSMSRLRWLEEKTRGVPEFREHPHKYFEAAGLLALPKADLRLDVNTPDDYDFLTSIYDYFGHNRFTTEEALSCPAVQARNRNAAKNNVGGV